MADVFLLILHGKEEKVTKPHGGARPKWLKALLPLHAEAGEVIGLVRFLGNRVLVRRGAEVADDGTPCGGVVEEGEEGLAGTDLGERVESVEALEADLPGVGIERKRGPAGVAEEVVGL